MAGSLLATMRARSTTTLACFQVASSCILPSIMTAPYVICFTNGCMADYDASGADLIAKMKKGQGLVIQAINSTGQPISLVLPLADFGKAYDGPPTDPKVFEEQQKKLQDELQRRADEARKKLESQQGQPQSSNPVPGSPQASGKP